jgi:SAM-dependent methyltransferase
LIPRTGSAWDGTQRLPPGRARQPLSATRLLVPRCRGASPRRGGCDLTAPGDPSAREKLIQLTSGYRLTQALYVVAKLEIADRLVAGPRDAESLAREVGAHPDRLFRVLRALASLGVFSMDAERRFGLTPMGEYLRTDAPGSVAAFATFQGEEPYRAFGELLHTVRTGETAFGHVYGMGHFDYLAHHPEASALFHRTMAGTVAAVDDPVEGCDLRDRHVVVDIGGGRGVLLAAVLRRYPSLTGILFDLPEAVTDASAFLESRGVLDRVEVRTGSAFDSVPAGGDVYVMSRILHDWPDEKAVQLLRNCRAAIPDGGLLLLREGVLGEAVPAPVQAQLDLMMMAVPGGRERTESEWRALLAQAGFALQHVLGEQRPQALITAVPVATAGRR